MIHEAVGPVSTLSCIGQASVMTISGALGKEGSYKTLLALEQFFYWVQILTI